MCCQSGLAAYISIYAKEHWSDLWKAYGATVKQKSLSDVRSSGAHFRKCPFVRPYMVVLNCKKKYVWTSFGMSCISLFMTNIYGKMYEIMLYWQKTFLNSLKLSKFKTLQGLVELEYSLIPITRHVPIHKHASRHRTCHVPIKGHASKL